jgi:hypothetical protein
MLINILFQSALWHSTPQYHTRLHDAHRMLAGLLHALHTAPAPDVAEPAMLPPSLAPQTARSTPRPCHGDPGEFKDCNLCAQIVSTFVILLIPPQFFWRAVKQNLSAGRCAARRLPRTARAGLLLLASRQLPHALSS